jgi:hypothetical protein
MSGKAKYRARDCHVYSITGITKLKLRGLSPRANYITVLNIVVHPAYVIFNNILIIIIIIIIIIMLLLLDQSTQRFFYVNNFFIKH